MWRLLRSVSLPAYRAAPARLALSIVGIGAGVALVAGLAIVNASVLANFRASLERAAGRAALQVVLGTGEAGFAEAVAVDVAKVPGVLQAFGLVRGTLAAVDAPGEVLQLFGVDLASEAVEAYDVRAVDPEIDQLELLNDPRSVLVAETWAARHGIGVGDRLRVAGPAGIVALHVRGLLRPEGLATIFGGALAVMDLPAAQLVLGKPGRVDQVDIVVREGEDVGAIAQRVREMVPESLRIERPELRGERFERVIAAFQAMLDGLSLLCLLAGVFIVYNSGTTAVTQRARDLAILMAIGIDRWRVFALVTAEACVLGLGASLLGLLGGLGIARVLLDLVAESMGVIYQSRFVVETFVLAPHQALGCIVLGTLASLAAAVVPALRASRLDPIELMRADYRERLQTPVPDRRLLQLGGIVVGLSLGALVLAERTRSVAWGNLSASLWYVATLVVSIPAMGALTRGLRRWLPRLAGIEGRIAAESLARSPARTGVTAAVIGLALTVAITVAAVARSFRESERDWFILAGDLVVSSVATEGGWLETPLAGEVESLLREIPGVARVETYRALQGQDLGDARIAVVAVSRGFVDAPAFRRSLVPGDSETVRGALRAGRGVLVSDNLASRLGVAVGDELALPTPTGVRSVTVLGVLAAEYSGEQGSVVLERELLAQWWGDRQVSHFNLFLAPGADALAVREDVLRRLAGRWLVKVLTVREALAYHQQMVDRAFAFTWAIQLLVVVVTLAGVFDLLTTQMLERRQELGILRALGMEEERVRAAVQLEAAVLGLAGGLLGALVAVATSILWVRVNFRILIGYVIALHYPVSTAFWSVTLAGGVALLAGHLAVRGALREPVLDALRAE